MSSGALLYPTHCTNVLLDQGQCGESLLTSDQKPIRPFMYHHLNDFIGNLLSRPDLEQYIDTACDDIKGSEGPLDFVNDVLDAPFLQTFKGPDRKLFIDRGDEGRLVFTLCVDFFVVEGMRIRGASVSCGIIALICLNLPWSIRYRFDNMYLAGLVPTPQEPPDVLLNHYASPLVQDLRLSWERGVRYSKTALHPGGRVIRAAIAMGICDSKGARKLGGFTSISSDNFCYICPCHKQADWGHTDYQSWGQRDTEHMKKIAEEWRDAASVKARERIAAEHGLRHSILWDLPYWDPPSQLPVDPMHCILEGLIPHQFRTVLQLTDSAAQGKAAAIPAYDWEFAEPIRSSHPDYPNLPSDRRLDKNQITDVRRINAALVSPLEYDGQEIQLSEAKGYLVARLQRKLKPALAFVYNSLDLPPLERTTKQIYAEQLVEWVSHSNSCSGISLHYIFSVF